ncbi:MAG: rhodanese-like domain-containing protein [Acidobacteriota bacterium]|nr:rhodanese-like domain-containing protein [Acidobacteriota bacterium]
MALKSPSQRKLEIIFDAAIVVTALVLCGLLIKRYYAPAQVGDAKSTLTDTVQRLKIGSRFPLTGLDWAKNAHTLVLAISKDCKYCAESIVFYRQLSMHRRGQSHFRLMVILPQSANDGLKQLNDSGVFVDEVRQMPLQSIGLDIVPTLLLVNDQGIITNIWSGKMLSNQESELFSHLGIRTNVANMSKQVRGVGSTSWASESPIRSESSSGKTDAALKSIEKAGSIRPEDLDRLIKSGKSFVIVDVRDRDAYLREHRPGAKNIPLDEIEARAINELPTSALIVADCHCSNGNQGETAREILRKSGFLHVVWLTN